MQPAVQLLRLRRRGRWWLLGAREPDDLLLTVRLRRGRGGRGGPPHGRADRWQSRAVAAVVFESGARIAFGGHQPDTGPSTVNLLPPIRLRTQSDFFFQQKLNT